MASNRQATKKSAGMNILVTGGALGLGRSIVTSFAETGARVVIADGDKELGMDLEEKLAAEGLQYVKRP
jgi:NAD(P)-dependent dehydrogenase (short-subunit alcohol dehydrogenase family)